jgi:hypothetical protein
MPTPASAPTSPAFPRGKQQPGARAGIPPVTPQRFQRPAVAATAAGKLQHANRGPSLLSRSPVTPAGAASPASTGTSPYTPQLSNRSLTASDNSLLATPPTADAAPLPALAIDPTGADASPELSLLPLSPLDKKRPRGPGGADAVSNWRSRASQNGIRVTSSAESQFADDEGARVHVCARLGAILTHISAFRQREQQYVA